MTGDGNATVEEYVLEQVASSAIKHDVVHRQQWWTTLALALMFLLIAVASVASAVGILAYKQQNRSLDRLAAVAASNHEITVRIRSCTDPGGSCYQRGQAQTAKAVQNINEVMIDVGVCIKDPTVTAPQVRSCVIRAMQRAGRRP